MPESPRPARTTGAFERFRGRTGCDSDIEVTWVRQFVLDNPR